MNVYAVDFNKVKLEIKEDINKFNIDNIKVKNGDQFITIDGFSMHDNILTLKNDINIKYECFIYYENQSFKVSFNNLFKSYAFNYRFYYNGELGSIYNKNYTIFKVWSPAASHINLMLYKNGDESTHEAPIKISMDENNGLWTTVVEKDLDGFFYTYEVNVYGSINEAVDPYAKAVGVNGVRGAVIDLNKTNPQGWQRDHTDNLKNYTDAIIYETSIRDISSYPKGGIKNKGKYKGLSEENTVSFENLSTGLSHIKELGITHIQLMPIFDFKNVDERNPVEYNWGYDPQNYNVPEGSYSENPYDPKCRILELKETIQSIHKNGLKVNMDVVYNHLWNIEKSNFNKIFPGYYFRSTDKGHISNGSGCGNDTSSENAMMRKFIIDSVLYWAKEYHIDGFRFDLMGLHDIFTMNFIKQHFKNLGKNIMIYGEGWNLNTALPDDKKCTKENAYKTPDIGYFNDIIRDVIKGNVFDLFDQGFVSGKQNLEPRLKHCIQACTISDQYNKSLFASPEQSINYISCHDNSTLWDKFNFSNKNDSYEFKKNMVKLACGILLTSQGVPFLDSGVEIGRTKYGVINSFNSPDNINWIDWDRKSEFIDVFNYIKGIIKIRKNHPAFRMNTTEKISNHLNFINSVSKNTVAFLLRENANGDLYKNIFVVYNANRNPITINLPYGKWYTIVNENISGEDTIEVVSNNQTEVKPISMKILHD